MNDRVPYDIDGPVDGPPIVFLHGSRLSRTMWRPQIEDLRDTYRVIAVDLPGHGALAGQPFTIEGAAAEVERAIEEAAGGRAVVVGLSLGGYVAMDLAARRPDLIRALVLSGATTEPVGRLATPYLALAWVIERLQGRWFEAINDWYFRTRYAPAIAEPIIAGGFWAEGGAQALRAIVGERFAPRLARYPGRTLIINGDRDLFFRLSARRFSRVARERHRIRLRGATHLANLDRPRAFNHAIRRFVEGLPEPDPLPGDRSADGREEAPVLDLADPPSSS